MDYIFEWSVTRNVMIPCLDDARKLMLDTNKRGKMCQIIASIYKPIHKGWNFESKLIEFDNLSMKIIEEFEQRCIEWVSKQDPNSAEDLKLNYKSTQL